MFGVGMVPSHVEDGKARADENSLPELGGASFSWDEGGRAKDDSLAPARVKILGAIPCLRSQNFPLNFPTRRRLCSTLGARIIASLAPFLPRVLAPPRRHYDQLSALQPGLRLIRPLWRSKGLRARQAFHDLPPDDRLLASQPIGFYP